MRLKMMMTCCVGLLLLLTVVPAVTHATVPQQINYQGYLAGSDGNPVPDSNYVMSFAIYNVSGGGTPLWSEAQTVTVASGVYNVILGQSGNPINPDIFDGDRYLGVAVGEDSEMTPRQKLTSTAFSMKAAKADSVAEGAVTSVMIANGAVDSTKLSDSSVTAAKIVDGSVTAADIADGAGSGLDADMLDGHGSSHFATAAYVASLEARIAVLENILQHFSRNGNDITITGANVNVVNGTGSTAGTPNGLGNLIIGYNEARTSGSNKSGSHNLVVGPNHNYSSLGGLVAGFENTVSHMYASVSGGEYNIASNVSNSVSGGRYNTASGNYCSISGGRFNTATGYVASISGGRNNTASGDSSSISGGRYNTASGISSFVGGGGGLTSFDGNEAFSNYSAILGGLLNDTGNKSTNDRSIGEQATVSGGKYNTASGHTSSVSGGRNNTASGTSSSISGGYENTASGNYSNVSGGRFNTAFSHYSAVLGGQLNIAGDRSDPNDHDIGKWATVSGGVQNNARGQESSVSGGYTRFTTGFHDWAAGGLYQNN